MVDNAGGNGVAIDVEALERKYAEERAKRVRSDGNAQYQPLSGRFADLARDPNADPDYRRDAMVEDLDVLVIGGGFAGMLAGGRMREKGIDSFRIIEKGADFGGTWYWNRYPGAACDVEAYIYLPLLEEVGYRPTERYPQGPEIHAYCRKLADHFSLYDAALFQTSVQSVEWDETLSRWIVATDRGDRFRARFVISCTGLLSNPKLPSIPGIESFAGHVFHTSRWDYDYTGGDQTGGLTGLSGKRVGVVGTGSTGVQVVPHVAKWAGELFVFQRTPSSIEVRDNRPADPAFFDGLKPGWQRERRNNFTALLGGQYEPVDMVGDSWTDIIRNVSPRYENGEPVTDPEAVQKAEMQKMELARQRIADIVEDPETAEALKPYFHYFCKRPCFHDEYLTMFNRPNVTLVDTQGRGIEHITPRGAVVGGTLHPLDCMIFATGFDFLGDYSKEAGMIVKGQGGVTLSEHNADGPHTLFGIQTRGFPNFFMMSIAQAGAAVNYVHTADAQTETIVHIIGETLARGCATVQPEQAAESEWVRNVVEGSQGYKAFLEACTPGYYNYEGKRGRSADTTLPYPGGPMAYIDLLEKWRGDPDLSGFELAPRPG